MNLLHVSAVTVSIATLIASASLLIDFRYKTATVGGESPVGYVLDQWTGDAYMLRGYIKHKLTEKEEPEDGRFPKVDYPKVRAFSALDKKTGKIDFIIHNGSETHYINRIAFSLSHKTDKGKAKILLSSHALFINPLSISEEKSISYLPYSVTDDYEFEIYAIDGGASDVNFVK